MKYLLLFLILIILLLSCYRYEYFSFTNTSNGLFECDHNTDSNASSYRCNKIISYPPKVTDNHYYCGTGKDFGCNGNFRCEKSQYSEKCNNISNPFSNTTGADTSLKMKEYNNYLKLPNVKNFCNKFSTHCNSFKELNSNQIKELKEVLGVNDMSTNCGVIMDKYGKYCTNCIYDYVKNNKDVNVYLADNNTNQKIIGNDIKLPAQISTKEFELNF